MIRHIVLFTAKDKGDIDKIIDGLSPLATIPHARRLEVARNRKTDQLGNDIDVVVYGEFDDEADHHDVPDPYYGGDDGFERVHDMVERACAALLGHIREARL